ncbi:hypothetical protein KY290_037546 [Solanum tuberosum]|uniref:Uncharacterized protein n=1 Tax=Solanum tuberosum TaxID=4113 RepID=A0ABQ7TXI3_SOLTU|nr:hypothetical protein KY284_036898 [Solanum tuberosum]KAH0738841.1 hypothetical protein KY290_037546 [Solanum tuberosum]
MIKACASWTGQHCPKKGSFISGHVAESARQRRKYCPKNDLSFLVMLLKVQDRGGSAGRGWVVNCFLFIIFVNYLRDESIDTEGDTKYYIPTIKVMTGSRMTPDVFILVGIQCGS